MKYTKGKWRICSFAEGHVENEDGRLVAACMGYSTNADNGDHRKENIANAKLISKVPEINEALEEFNIQLNKLKADYLTLMMIQYPEFTNSINRLRTLFKEIEL